MSTTNLFVELVVIGVGVFIWLALLVFSFVGVSLEQISNTWLIGSAIPTLAFIYVLGIIWDRFVDNIFDRLWGDSLRREYFDHIEEYYNARRNILVNSEPLSDLLEYGRSRLRICRGWSVNALLIGICLNVYLWLHGDSFLQATRISLIGSVACVALAIGSWFAWQNLTKVEYRKIKDQSKFVANYSH